MVLQLLSDAAGSGLSSWKIVFRKITHKLGHRFGHVPSIFHGDFRENLVGKCQDWTALQHKTYRGLAWMAEGLLKGGETLSDTGLHRGFLGFLGSSIDNSSA